MKNILIKLGDLKITAVLNGSETAGKIWDALPIKSFTSTWGDEVYFQIPVKAKIESGFAKEVVEIGEIGFWPEGSCFCIFFGETPVSKPGEIRPASAVNIIGKIEGDWEDLLDRMGDDYTRKHDGVTSSWRDDDEPSYNITSHGGTVKVRKLYEEKEYD